VNFANLKCDNFRQRYGIGIKDAIYGTLIQGPNPAQGCASNAAFCVSVNLLLFMLRKPDNTQNSV